MAVRLGFPYLGPQSMVLILWRSDGTDQVLNHPLCDSPPIEIVGNTNDPNHCQNLRAIGTPTAALVNFTT